MATSVIPAYTGLRSLTITSGVADIANTDGNGEVGVPFTMLPENAKPVYVETLGFYMLNPRKTGNAQQPWWVFTAIQNTGVIGVIPNTAVSFTVYYLI